MERHGWGLPVILSGLLFFWTLGIPGAEAEQRDEKNVRFRWAFGAMVGPKNDRRLVAITRDTRLKTGDQLKMFVQLQNKCYLYLIYRSGKEEVQLLFPYAISQFTSDYEPFKKYYIPQGDLWFELDQEAGLESFYLLASARRLTSLEKLLEAHESAKTGDKAAIAKKIVAEIRTIRRQNRKVTTVAERPVQIGGNVRGISEDKKGIAPNIDPIASEVSATDFYGRTFTIDHH